MEWWQIVIAIVFNVPWLYAFFACVVVPCIKSATKNWDKEELITFFSSIFAVLLAIAGIVLLFAVFIWLVMGNDIPNVEVMPIVVAVSGGVLVISIITLLILKPRR